MTLSTSVSRMGMAFNNATWAGVGWFELTVAYGDGSSDVVLDRAPTQLGVDLPSTARVASGVVPLPLGGRFRRILAGATSTATASAASPQAACVNDPEGTTLLMVYRDASLAVVVDEAGPVTLSDPSGVAAYPSGVVDELGRAWVVFVAGPDGGSGLPDSTSRVYLTWSDEPGVWSTPVLVDDGASGAVSFPAVAVSGAADANGDGRVVLVVWRVDATASGEFWKNIRYGAARVDGATGLGAVGDFAGADGDTGDTALTAYVSATRNTGERARDPSAWATPDGAFFVGYTHQNVGAGDSTVVVQHTTGPAHGGAWSGEAELGLPDEAPDFVYGTSNVAAGWAAAVWEAEADPDGAAYPGKRVAAAICDLSGEPSTWTWEPVGVVSTPTTADDNDGLPCCVVTSDGTLHVFHVRSDGSGRSPRLHYQHAALP